MNGPHFLAGASIAALVITQVYWLCGFLRMTSTGLSAQAKGSQESVLINRSLFQGIFIGFILASILLLFNSQILQAGLFFADTTTEIELVFREYFSLRIWGAPAAMANLAIIGWLIGQQKARKVLAIQIMANLLNVILNFWFVLGLQLEVFGVALATVMAEYFIFITSLIVALKVLDKPIFKIQWLSLTHLKPIFGLNADTFIRNLVLQACIAFLIFQGVAFGTQAAAINAIIMQFFTLIALGLDGVAFAAEALVGEKKGKKDHAGVIKVTLHGLVWSTVLALFYSLIFYLWGSEITSLITDQTSLQLAMQDYMPYVILLPIIAHWCFYFDGIFVGLTRAIAMRNSMIVSGVGVYFPAIWLFSTYQNQALWIAMLFFMLSRGITLGGYFSYLCQKKRVAV
jgi:MATE family multidrug resistance protein